jgi:hypothetical protein
MLTIPTTYAKFFGSYFPYIAYAQCASRDRSKTKGNCRLYFKSVGSFARACTAWGALRKSMTSSRSAFASALSDSRRASRRPASQKADQTIHILVPQRRISRILHGCLSNYPVNVSALRTHSCACTSHRSNASAKRHTTEVELSYGGDLDIGSGEDRADDSRRVESCAPNGKWITSVAAIVAPHPCDLVRGASVLVTPARPAMSLNLFLLDVGSFAAALAKMFLSVLFQFGESFLVPITKTSTSRVFGDRSRD